MKHLQVLLCGLLLAALPTAPALADTISTFTVTNGTFKTGATLEGSVVIDTTTGSITNVDLTYQLGATVKEFVGPSGQGAYAGNVFEFDSNDTTNDELIAIIEGTTVAGYTGGDLCSLNTPVECAYGGEGGWFTTAWSNSITFDYDVLQSGSLVLTSTETTGPSSVTPEPASFALLGTGLIGMCGAIRRRIRI